MSRPKSQINIAPRSRLVKALRRLLARLATGPHDVADDRRAIRRALSGQLSEHLTKDVGGED